MLMLPWMGAVWIGRVGVQRGSGGRNRYRHRSVFRNITEYVF